MYAHEKKSKENKSRAAANLVGQKKSTEMQGIGFMDKKSLLEFTDKRSKSLLPKNRPEPIDSERTNRTPCVFPIMQRVKIPGVYELTKDSNLREKNAPYTISARLKRGDTLVVKKGAEEARFDLGWFSLKKNHTWVTTTVKNHEGWVKDENLKKDEKQTVNNYYENENKKSRSLISEKPQCKYTRDRETANLDKFENQKRLILHWIPADVDTTNLYEFIKSLNHNMLKGKMAVSYTRKYNGPERLMSARTGDCRSICEINKFIAETILGAHGIQIESVNDGVRVAGSTRDDDKYSNHHWLNINGKRFDAMEDRDFTFTSWEVHRSNAWRPLAELDINPGISENSPF